MRNKLIKRREKLGLSQAEVARRIGVGRSHYCNIEKGKRGITLDLAHKISIVLDIEFNYENFENKKK